MQDEEFDSSDLGTVPEHVLQQQLQELAGRLGDDSPVDFERDFEWAYQYQSLDMQPAAAPSLSAWTMYCYARSSKAKFAEMAVKYYSDKKKRETAVSQARDDDMRKQFGFIDLLLSECAPAAARARRASGNDLRKIIGDRDDPLLQPLPGELDDNLEDDDFPGSDG